MCPCILSEAETHLMILQQFHPFDIELYRDNPAYPFLPYQINSPLL